MIGSTLPLAERRTGGAIAHAPGRAVSAAPVCVVGPMTGRRGGRVTTQGERLVDSLRAEGRVVYEASAASSRLGRLVGILSTVARRRGACPILVVQTYGGRSFLVEDAASALGRRLGYRIVFHLHGGDMPHFAARHPRWTRRVLARGDAWVAPSRFLADALRDTVPRAIRVIPNVIDARDYPFRLRTTLRPRLFWMRSFHPLYNPELALRVLARVRARHPAATLTMAGQDCGALAATRAAAAQLDLSDAVRFPGFLDRAGKAREAEGCDIFLNTNRVDNAPVAVLEAMMMGLPVVATAVGGVPDLLAHGRAGMLVPDDDVQAMADGVCRLLDDPRLAERYARAGREVAGGASWATAGPAWKALLDALRATAAVPRASVR